MLGLLVKAFSWESKRHGFKLALLDGSLELGSPVC